MTRVRRLGALALGLLGLAGCGPIEYVSQVSNRARRALAEARAQGADRRAPYEYALADAYLIKAREEGARSSYQRAIDFGRRAEEQAQRAMALARERAAGKTP